MNDKIGAMAFSRRRIPLATTVRIVLEDCDAARLVSERRLESAMRALCAAARLGVVGALRHRYSPQGWTLVLVLKESHLILHTWPEHRAAVVELLSCRRRNPVAAIAARAAAALGAGRRSVKTERLSIAEMIGSRP